MIQLFRRNLSVFVYCKKKISIMVHCRVLQIEGVCVVDYGYPIITQEFGIQALLDI